MGIWRLIDTAQPVQVDLSGKNLDYQLGFHHVIVPNEGQDAIDKADAMLLRVKSSGVMTAPSLGLPSPPGTTKEYSVPSEPTSFVLWPRDPGIKWKEKNKLATMTLAVHASPHWSPDFGLFGSGVARRTQVGNSLFFPIFNGTDVFPYDETYESAAKSEFLAQVYGSTPGDLRGEDDPWHALSGIKRPVVVGFPPLGQIHYTISMFNDNTQKPIAFVGNFLHDLWLWTAP